eukprot:11717122-Karenia_brevis.AAC.1
MHPKRAVVHMLKLSTAVSHNCVASNDSYTGSFVGHASHSHFVRHVMQFQRKSWSVEPLEDQLAHDIEERLYMCEDIYMSCSSLCDAATGPGPRPA